MSQERIQTTAEQDKYLTTLQEVYTIIQKTQINLKKCPKQRLTKGYIQARLKILEDYWNTFKQAHSNLTICTPREQRGILPYFLNEDFYQVEDLYLVLQADLSDHLIKMEAPEIANVSTVQSLSFHPLEAQTLLSGACDGRARVTDCRAPDSHRSWALPPEIERVQWDRNNPFCFVMSNNEGKVAYVDCRRDEPMWTISAHEKEVTGLILSENIPGLMITVSSDEKLKTWDISGLTPLQISERSCKVGQALCASPCPDAPLSVAVGGDNKQNYIEMVDLSTNEEIINRFGSRVNPPNAAPSSESMDT